MIVLWLLLIAVAVSILWHVRARRLETRLSDEVFNSEEVARKEDDLLSFELGARVFSSDDYRLVKSETSTRFARWFDHERTALALDWLARVQTQVRKITSEHRISAAQSPGLKPARELELAFQFLVFEAIGRILYCLILVHGPANLSVIVERFLSATARLRTLLEHTETPTATMNPVEN